MPILIHCTAGKDRTGIAVALLLELIGVPREWVLWDYEQTNLHIRKHMVDAAALNGVGAEADLMSSLTPEARDIVLSVDRSYLAAALDSMEHRYGSVRRYLEEWVSVPAHTISLLRDQLGQPH